MPEDQAGEFERACFAEPPDQFTFLLRFDRPAVSVVMFHIRKFLHLLGVFYVFPPA